MYPAVVCVFGVGVSIFLMTYVVPNLLETLAQAGKELPAITQLVKAGSDFLLNWWWALLAGIVGLAAAVKAILRTETGRLAADRLALRVPLIVAGPGIEGGRTSDALVELIDVNPTICQLAGLPPQEKIDAMSLAPVLRGETDGHRTEAVSAIRGFRCIRTEGHKLIDNYGGPNELYDLAADPQELHNIAADEPQLARDLRRRMEERFMEGKWRR